MDKYRNLPPEIINYAVWLYFRIALGFRDLDNLLARQDLALPRHKLADGRGERGGFWEHAEAPFELQRQWNRPVRRELLIRPRRGAGRVRGYVIAK